MVRLLIIFIIAIGCTPTRNICGFPRNNFKEYKTSSFDNKIDTNYFYKLVKVKYLNYPNPIKDEQTIPENYLKFYSKNKIAYYNLVDDKNKIYDPCNSYMGYYYEKNNITNISVLRHHVQSGYYKVKYELININKDTLILESKEKKRKETYIKIEIDKNKYLKAPDW
jgi:hypothetical protein